MFLTKDRQDLCIEQNGLLSDNIFIHNYLRQLLYYVLKTQFKAIFFIAIHCRSALVLLLMLDMYTYSDKICCFRRLQQQHRSVWWRCRLIQKCLKCSFYKICDTTIAAISFQWWQYQMQYQYNTPTSLCFILQENMIVSIYAKCIFSMRMRLF